MTTAVYPSVTASLSVGFHGILQAFCTETSALSLTILQDPDPTVDPSFYAPTSD